jgi:GMP synthase-like glutamine amidotransferase
MTITNLHFALLKNDTPLPDVVKNAGDYGAQFATIFKKAADSKKLTITWDVFDVVNEQAYPSFKDVENGKYHAIVLTGSKYNAHDNDPWILKLVEFNRIIMNEYADKVKLVGICFGHQIILRAAGGITGRNEAGWEVKLLGVTFFFKNKYVN